MKLDFPGFKTGTCLRFELSLQESSDELKRSMDPIRACRSESIQWLRLKMKTCNHYNHLPPHFIGTTSNIILKLKKSVTEIQISLPPLLPHSLEETTFGIKTRVTLLHNAPLIPIFVTQFPVCPLPVSAGSGRSSL